MQQRPSSRPDVTIILYPLVNVTIPLKSSLHDLSLNLYDFIVIIPRNTFIRPNLVFLFLSAVHIPDFTLLIIAPLLTINNPKLLSFGNIK